MLEKNKIYNENCLDTMKKMTDNFVDVVFTSPPYNRKRNDKYKYYDDRMTDYYNFLVEIILSQNLHQSNLQYPMCQHGCPLKKEEKGG